MRVNKIEIYENLDTDFLVGYQPRHRLLLIAEIGLFKDIGVPLMSADQPLQDVESLVHPLLDTLFSRYNADNRANRTQRSMSVGDVIAVLIDTVKYSPANNLESARWYWFKCDLIGWTEVPERPIIVKSREVENKRPLQSCQDGQCGSCEYCLSTRRK